MLEHPDITYVLSHGCTKPQFLSAELVCPICGEELSWDDDVYVNRRGDIIGCGYCLRRRDAAEVCDSD